MPRFQVVKFKRVERFETIFFLLFFLSKAVGEEECALDIQVENPPAMAGRNHSNSLEGIHFPEVDDRSEGSFSACRSGLVRE